MKGPQTCSCDTPPPPPPGVGSGCRLWPLLWGKKGNWKLSSNCQKGLAGVTIIATHWRAVGGTGRLLCQKPALIWVVMGA